MVRIFKMIFHSQLALSFDPGLPALLAVAVASAKWRRAGGSKRSPEARPHWFRAWLRGSRVKPPR